VSSGELEEIAGGKAMSNETNEEWKELPCDPCFTYYEQSI
jgi:hypothetical protein